jgi:protein transport protein SEC24
VARHARVGIFTFHRSIQYYSIRSDHKEKIKLHIVDAWDPIGALPPTLWLKSVSSQWEDINLLLQRLPELIATEQGVDKESGYNTGGGAAYSGTNVDLKGACTGAAMLSAQRALEKTKAGGRVFILSPNSPSIGCPKVGRREMQTSYCGAAEVTLYGSPDIQPSSGKANAELFKDVAEFVSLGQACASTGVCIDVLLLINDEEYRDAALLGHVCDASGGSLVVLRGDVCEVENALRLEQQLQHCLRRSAGRNVTCKVRTSSGFKLERYYSKGVGRHHDGELDLAGIDEDTTVVGSFVWDGSKLNEDDAMHVQLAILYTDNRRRRLVRVHNLCLRATESAATVFRGADLDAVAYTIVAQAVEKALLVPIAADDGPRDFIKTTACDILFSYRVHCSPQSPRGQLILPDSLKLLPLYCLGMLKHPAFLDNVDLRGKTALIRGHERAHELRRLRSCPVGVLVHSLCPRLFELLRLSDATFSSSLEGRVSGGSGSGIGFGSGSGSGGFPGGSVRGSKHAATSWRMQLARARTAAALAPCTASISAEALDSSGVYLLDDGSSLYLHVGRNCTRVELEEWFSVPPHARPPHVTFNAEGSDSARHMLCLIEALQKVAPNKQQLVIVWGDEMTTPASTLFAMRLVEDSLYGNMSYTDFLCKLHASIQTRTEK